MKRSEVIDIILEAHYDPNDMVFVSEEAANKILDALLKAGMLPVSKRSGYCGTAVVYDWEENITEKTWNRAFDNVGRD